MRNNPYYKNLKEHIPLMMQGPRATTAFIFNEEQKSIIEETMKLPDPKQYQVKGVSFNMISPPLLNLNATLNLEIVLNIEMGQTEVTQELFQAVMGWNDSKNKRSLQNPVEMVTWYDCLSFCNKLSALLGFEECYRMLNIKKEKAHIKKAEVQWDENKNGFRLPRVYEWELFAKTGTENRWSGTNDEKKLKQYAWYDDNAGYKTKPVGKKLPNEWGLYDMTGNVIEWCWDPHETPREAKISHRILGGSCFSPSEYCVISDREGSSEPDQRMEFLGFRLCRSFN